MVILTLNCGSSSAKYQVYDWTNKDILAVGVVERIGLEYSTIEHKANSKPDYNAEFSSPTHKEAIELIIKMLLDEEYGVITSLDQIGAVGHRVVHGGEIFKSSALVTDEVLQQLKSFSHLAPLHNPPNILGIEAALEAIPSVPQAIVLDTAFHQTMEKDAYHYALPRSWYTEHNVRRYGFHGTSHLYCAKRAAAILDRPNEDTNLIICHIGNGASITAVKGGVSVDTSMGMTPLEGLIMGTRCGDIDPAIIPYMMKKTGMNAEEIDAALNKESGLVGICGKSDRRDVEAASKAGDASATLAIDMECRRIAKYIGAYATLLGGRVDAIVFTAGVGEMAPQIRRGACKGIEVIGAKLDQEKNEACRSRNGEFAINTDDSPVKILVIPTDEELVMTEDAYALMDGSYDVHTNFRYTFEDRSYENKGRARDLVEDIKKNPKLKEMLAI
ncbi:MAG TPA: acetate kinase [Sphaerochaeta sp.]|nr:acetate kinase [Sphaerochaeta sp.]